MLLRHCVAVHKQSVPVQTETKPDTLSVAIAGKLFERFSQRRTS